MSTAPFSNAGVFFAGASGVAQPREIDWPEIDNSADRRFCRCCLQRIGVERERSTLERGAIRTHLGIPDDGNELAFCNHCWDGVAGVPILIQGRVVPHANPFAIPNPLLATLVEKAP